jgi:hypothetical protein
MKDNMGADLLQHARRVDGRYLTQRYDGGRYPKKERHPDCYDPEWIAEIVGTCYVVICGGAGIGGRPRPCGRVGWPGSEGTL